MSIIRQLLGLNFFKREPWRFPDPHTSRSGGVSIGNTRTLKRDLVAKEVSFTIDREVVPGLSPRRSEVREEGEALPLHVKLRGEQSDTKVIVSRRRNLTRLGTSSSSIARLNNVMFLSGAVTSEEALSIGYAAVELGLNYLRVVAPRGRDAIEQLRTLRTITARFNLSLIIAVGSSEDLEFCFSWADVIEIEINREGERRDLLRRVFNSDKTLAIRRGQELPFDEFVRVTSWIQLESAKQLIIFEGGSRSLLQGGATTFCVGLIQKLKEKTGAEVILDLTRNTKNAPIGVLLSGITSGVNGLGLCFDHKAATESFDELQGITQKLGAIKYTLNALSQIN
jgi:3-deoxy-D-arabino-heptulosonate 7-phosphate (DAHP) synthase